MSIEEKVLKLYKDAGHTHRETVQSLALICADGIAAMGEKGFKISSDEIEVLITIRVKL